MFFVFLQLWSVGQWARRGTERSGCASHGWRRDGLAEGSGHPSPLAGKSFGIQFGGELTVLQGGK